VFKQGAICKLDSFDRWGVELPVMSGLQMTPELDLGHVGWFTHCGSTSGLIRRLS
jgi:hypothetical protein